MGLNTLTWLNSGNPAGLIQTLTLSNLLQKFPDEELIGLEIGSAYGGGVEVGAKLWKGRGKFYGYDTFEGHPKDLAVSPDNIEAWCMDFWYTDEAFGREGVTYEYQRRELDAQGLDNAILVKGRLNEHSFDDIKKAHFVMIDLDIIASTVTAYTAIKDKIVIGGYLFLHDALPEGHMPLINRYVYNRIIPENRWKTIAESEKGNLVALERWVNVEGSLNGEPLNLNTKGWI